MPPIQKYINISSNVISGYNNAIRATINLGVLSTSNTVIGLNYSTTNLGFEILPNPADGGIIRYRYLPNSTTTILGFDGPNMFMNITKLTANNESIINPITKTTAINLFIDRNSQGGVIGINSASGLSRIVAGVDINQQGELLFFSDDIGTLGTQVNTSSVASNYLVGSTIELATGVLLHPPNDLAISSLLNMDINGNLYWNGVQINPNVPPVPPNPYPSTVYFDEVYTSTLQTTNVFLRGNNSLNVGLLEADANLVLYWNGVPLQTQTINFPLEYAQIANVSSLKVTTSTIQGVYDTPSLPPKWVICGYNNASPSPLYTSLDEQETYIEPQTNGIFNGGGNSIYGNIYTGQIIAVGTDNTNSFSTIQWSTDAQNWNNLYTNNPFANTANTVYYANNLWLIGGASSLPNKAPILWSTDGYNFNEPHIYPTSATGPNVNSFSFNGKLYVAGLDTGFDNTYSLLWSTDGRDWNKINTGGFNTTNVVGSNNNLWLASGPTNSMASNRIQWSTDALNWNNSLHIPADFNTGNAMKYANGIWVMGGAATNPYATLLWSSDGLSWNTQDSGLISNVYDIKYIHDVWYATGDIDTYCPNGVLTSVDGINWSQPSTFISSFYDSAITNIYYLETVLLGNGSITLSPSTSMYITATVSSYTLNATNIVGQNSNLTSAYISSLSVNKIVSPNFLQLQSIAF